MKKEGIVALGFFCIGIIGLSILLQHPFGTLHKPDVAFFPVLVSVLLTVLSVVTLTVSLMTTRAKEKRVNFGEHWMKLIPAAVVIIAYVFLLKPVGYIACTFIAVVFFARLVNCSWKSSFLISLICTGVSFVALRYYLMSPIPRGVIPL